MAKTLREDIHDIAVTLDKLHQQIKSAADTYHADKERKSAPLRAELHIPQAEAQRNEATQVRQERRDRKRLWIEAAALGAVIVYAWLTYGQWSQMKQSSKFSERAWGEITSMGIENIKLSDIMTVAYPEQITNAGNSPAKEIRIESVIEIVDRNKPPSFTYPLPHSEVMTSILFPKEKYDFAVIMRRPNNTEAVLTDEERQRLSGGLAYIAVYGTVTYRDGFGPHWTHYCWWTSYGGTAFSANQCVQYNDTDE